MNLNVYKKSILCINIASDKSAFLNWYSPLNECFVFLWVVTFTLKQTRFTQYRVLEKINILYILIYQSINVNLFFHSGNGETLEKFDKYNDTLCVKWQRKLLIQNSKTTRRNAFKPKQQRSFVCFSTKRVYLLNSVFEFTHPHGDSTIVISKLNNIIINTYNRHQSSNRTRNVI